MLGTETRLERSNYFVKVPSCVNSCTQLAVETRDCRGIGAARSMQTSTSHARAGFPDTSSVEPLPHSRVSSPSSGFPVSSLSRNSHHILHYVVVTGVCHWLFYY